MNHKSPNTDRASAVPDQSTPTQASILVADDNGAMREVIVEILDGRSYSVNSFDPALPDEALLRRTYDVVILDIMMPGRDGFQLREEILRCSPHAQFIAMTGHPDPQKLDRAMNMGFFSFLTKPFTAEQLTYSVMGALRMKRLIEENQVHDFEQEAQRMGLIGPSAGMRRLRLEIFRLAPLTVPVLITGESGTGKDVVARCVHQYGRRSDKPLTPVNCAGLTPTLVESELFGHVQGAFTGATKTKFGYFEVSDNGTLFLDEIGDFPLELQSKLLRVLDSGEFCRVGDTVVHRTDVRIISATNRDLDALVKQGGFRADLFYRLRGAQIRLSPLRERQEDIPSLVGHFLREERIAVAPDAMDELQRHAWPGNVRELRMVVETLRGLAANGIITRDAVKAILGSAESSSQSTADMPPSYKEFKHNVLTAADRSYFEALLHACDGIIAEAARRAGMDRKNLYEKLKELGLHD
jgi:DNA-binding NtrC family response regulator